jgi:hypothetical protein
MKHITLTMIVLFASLASVVASTTIDTNNAYAYGANIG